MSTTTVQPNDFVVIKRIFDDGYRLIRADPEGTYFFNKENVELSCLIGLPFGSVLELNRQEHTLKRATLTESEMFEVCDLNAEMDTASDIDSIGWRDNRNLLDDQSSQKLSMEEIECLKQSASSNREIIDNLVKNSSTFESKSVFSQAKYIKKKKQKYTNHYRLLKPSIKLLTEMYFIQGPSKQTNLRLDTLAQMMAAVNVRAGGKYMVVDNYLGLLTAAVIDRLIGVNPANLNKTTPNNFGCCIQMYLEAGPVASWRSGVEAMNFPKDALDQVLFSCQIHQVYNNVLRKKQEKEMTTEKIEDDFQDDEDMTVGEEDKQNDNGTDGAPEKKRRFIPDCEVTEEDIAKRKKLDDRSKRKEMRKIEEKKALRLINSTRSQEGYLNLDGFLVISRNMDPSSFVDVLLDLISPSSPFAIYNHVSEPLAACMVKMKDRAVNMRLSSTWLRRYQVLPGRTRPDMIMSTSGGFILTGTKIIN